MLSTADMFDSFERALILSSPSDTAISYVNEDNEWCQCRNIIRLVEHDNFDVYYVCGEMRKNTFCDFPPHQIVAVAKHERFVDELMKILD